MAQSRGFVIKTFFILYFSFIVNDFPGRKEGDFSKKIILKKDFYIDFLTDRTFKVIKEEDGIIDWETYTNEKYGFEIKFPPNWVLNRESTEDNFMEFTDRSGEILEKGWVDFSIEITPTIKTSLQEYLQEFSEQGQIEILEDKQITIDNLKAISREEFWTIAGFPVVSTYFLKNGLFFKLNMKFAKSGPNFTVYEIQPEDLGLNDRILSTFKFID